jgi:hypothetical protein
VVGSSEPITLDKVTTGAKSKTEVFLPFGEYQYHIQDFQPSVPRQYIHIFIVAPDVNTTATPSEFFFTDAHLNDGDSELVQDVSF